jgi:hypothetical protein
MPTKLYGEDRRKSGNLPPSRYNRQKLYKGQFGCREHHSVADVAACLTEEVYQSWAKGKIAGAILMDVKGAFDHVSRTRLTKRLEELEADLQLIRWTDNFMKERKVSLIINGHETAMELTNSGIPQGSPVSPILFAIYMSGVFERWKTRQAHWESPS